MRAESYQTKPDQVKAIKLENNNIEQVASWCNGRTTYYYEDDLADEVHINGYLAKVGRHWIVLQNNSFKAIPNDKFVLDYEQVSETSPEDIVFDTLVMGLEELKYKFRNYGKSARSIDEALEDMFGRNNDEE